MVSKASSSLLSVTLSNSPFVSLHSHFSLFAIRSGSYSSLALLSSTLILILCRNGNVVSTVSVQRLSALAAAAAATSTSRSVCDGGNSVANSTPGGTFESFSEWAAAPEEPRLENLAATVWLSVQWVGGDAGRPFRGGSGSIILCGGNALFVFGLGGEAPSARQLIVRSVLWPVLAISECRNVISDALSFLISGVKQGPRLAGQYTGDALGAQSCGLHSSSGDSALTVLLRSGSLPASSKAAGLVAVTVAVAAVAEVRWYK